MFLTKLYSSWSAGNPIALACLHMPSLNACRISCASRDTVYSVKTRQNPAYFSGEEYAGFLNCMGAGEGQYLLYITEQKYWTGTQNNIVGKASDLDAQKLV